MLSGCGSHSSESRMTEAVVLEVAKPAMAKRFPESYLEHKPYHASFQDGVWTVRGTLSKNVVGGTPEATVRDADGKVIEVFHTQ